MEIIIFVFGIFNFILLVMLLIRSLKNDNGTIDVESFKTDILSAINELKKI